MAPLIALHKFKEAVDYHTTAARPHRSRRIYNITAGVHGNFLGHAHHRTRTYCYLGKEDSGKLSKRYKFWSSYKLLNCRIKSFAVDSAHDMSKIWAAKKTQYWYKWRQYSTNVNGIQEVTTSHNRQIRRTRTVLSALRKTNKKRYSALIHRKDSHVV